MRYLLDTHAFLWYLEDSPKLPSRVAELIDSSENEIYICSVSLWEIVIKMSLNKYRIDFSLDDLYNEIYTYALMVLGIKKDYLKVLSELPFIHKDPFDRLIISSAIAEGLTIISIDENIHNYDVSCVWK